MIEVRLWFTDDPVCSDIGIQIGLNEGIFFTCDDPRHEDSFHGVNQRSVNEIINIGIEEGYFKVHLELNEWYYHSTQKGLDLLDSRIVSIKGGCINGKC